jgi:hypothetical protein
MMPCRTRQAALGRVDVEAQDMFVDVVGPHPRRQNRLSPQSEPRESVKFGSEHNASVIRGCFLPSMTSARRWNSC